MVVVLDRRLVSLLLTLGIVSFVLPAFIPGLGEYSIDTSLAVHGLVGLVLLLISTLYFSKFNSSGFENSLRNERNFFRLITENAADLIAVVDGAATVCITAPPIRNFLATPGGTKSDHGH